jgi:hypothetical protein
MSDGEPFYLPYIKLVDDEQYIHAGDGYNPLAKIIHNYEHKNLIIGLLKSTDGVILLFGKIIKISLFKCMTMKRANI